MATTPAPSLQDPVSLPVLAIFVDPQLSPRLDACTDLIERYATAMEAGAEFPPVVVGRKGSGYVLLDGLNRLYAHKRAHAGKPIAVLVSKATPDEFFAEAVRLNIAHGHALSNPERHKAVQRLHRDGYAVERIAKLMALPADIVARLTVGNVVRPMPARAGTSVVRTPPAPPPRSGVTAATSGKVQSIEQLLASLGERIAVLSPTAVRSWDVEAWRARLASLDESLEKLETQVRRQRR